MVNYCVSCISKILIKIKKEKVCIKRWNGRDMADGTCQPCKEVRVSKGRDTVSFSFKLLFSKLRGFDSI